jgi:hypothetical protein
MFRFVLLDQIISHEARMTSELSSEFRLFLAGAERSNDEGHAVFDLGEMREILGRLSTETGKRTPASRKTVYEAKGKLFRSGLLVANSGGETCLWIAAIKRRSSHQGACPIHRKRRRPFV